MESTHISVCFERLTARHHENASNVRVNSIGGCNAVAISPPQNR